MCNLNFEGKLFGNKKEAVFFDTSHRLFIFYFTEFYETRWAYLAPEWLDLKAFTSPSPHLVSPPVGKMFFSKGS